jgi:hypothetical protein
MFYFSLIYVSWILVVAGSADLSPMQGRTIDLFKYATDHEPNWTFAYNSIHPDLLDTYLSNCVQELHRRVKIHLNHIYAPGNHRGIPSRPHPYNGLPKLVYLIRYSNIRILNNIKSFLGPGDYDPLLEKINDEHVAYMSTLYVVMKRQKRPIESYLVDVAVLYSMNKRMLNIHRPSHQPPRLRFYQTLIRSMHHDLARFMQSTSELLTVAKFQQLESQVNALSPSNIHGTLNQNKSINQSNIHGYDRPEIQAQIYHLAHRILYVIVIYGSSSAVGLEMISSLLYSDSHRAVRLFLNVEPRTVPLLERPFHELLLSLATGLSNISHVFKPGHPWFGKLLQMVEMMMLLGNMKYLNHSNKLVQLGA